MDLDRNRLFSLQTKLLSLHKTFRGVGPDGQDMFTVKGHSSMKTTKMTCQFTNQADGRDLELEVRGGESSDFRCSGIMHPLESVFTMLQTGHIALPLFQTVEPSWPTLLGNTTTCDRFSADSRL